MGSSCLGHGLNGEELLGLCSTRCMFGARRCFLFRRTTSGLLMEEILWNLGLRNLIGIFHNLEWLCEMKIEEIRGLNMDLNNGWHFRMFPGIRKLPHFAT